MLSAVIRIMPVRKNKIIGVKEIHFEDAIFVEAVYRFKEEIGGVPVSFLMTKFDNVVNNYIKRRILWEQYMDMYV